MYTDPAHLKVSDPGMVQGNVVFTYLDAFSDDKQMVAELKDHYQKGGLGDVKIKTILNQVLQKFLAPIQQRRHLITEKQVRDVIYAGSAKAKLRAAQTLQEVRDVIGILSF